MNKEMILKKVVSFKTTKGALNYLNKLGIKTELGFNQSVDFWIEGVHYRKTKDKIIAYKKWDISFLDRDISDKPMCYGYKFN